MTKVTRGQTKILLGRGCALGGAFVAGADSAAV